MPEMTEWRLAASNETIITKIVRSWSKLNDEFLETLRGLEQTDSLTAIGETSNNQLEVSSLLLDTD